MEAALTLACGHPTGWMRRHLSLRLARQLLLPKSGRVVICASGTHLIGMGMYF